MRWKNAGNERIMSIEKVLIATKHPCNTILQTAKTFGVITNWENRQK